MKHPLVRLYLISTCDLLTCTSRSSTGLGPPGSLCVCVCVVVCVCGGGQRKEGRKEEWREEEREGGRESRLEGGRERERERGMVTGSRYKMC